MLLHFAEQDEAKQKMGFGGIRMCVEIMADKELGLLRHALIEICARFGERRLWLGGLSRYEGPTLWFSTIGRDRLLRKAKGSNEEKCEACGDARWRARTNFAVKSHREFLTRAGWLSTRARKERAGTLGPGSSLGARVGAAALGRALAEV